MSVETSELLERSEQIDQARETDQIVAIDFALETVRLWAAYHDIKSGTEHDTTNQDIVTRLFENESLQWASHRKGYSGNVVFPSNVSANICSAVSDVFGQNIFRIAKRSTNLHFRFDGLSEIVQDFNAVSNPEDHVPDKIMQFAASIIAAHAIYKRLDLVIDKGFKESIKASNTFVIAPGKEEAYWASKIFGSKGNPGIFQSKGALTRLFEPINNFTAQEYGENAQEYLAAWWAILNVINEGETNKEAIEPVVQALLSKDLASAQFMLKERLFFNEDSLPYRSRVRLALNEEETAFFMELNSSAQIQTPESDQGVISVAFEKALAKQAILVEQAATYTGSLLLTKSSRGEAEYVIVREMSSRPMHPNAKGVQQFDEGSVLPFALSIDYCEEVGDGTVHVNNKASGIRVPVQKFLTRMVTNNFQIIDMDEKYFDKNTKVFKLPE